MEDISNAIKGIYLSPSPSCGVICHAKLIKCFNTDRENFEKSSQYEEVRKIGHIENITDYVDIIEKGTSRTLCNILRPSSDCMYIRYVIYRREKDGTFCVLSILQNNSLVYCFEI